MSNQYKNIDFILNVLFDFVYDKPTECYYLKYKSVKTIKLQKLKLTMDADFDQENVLKTNITYENKNNGKLIFKRHSKKRITVLYPR